MKHGYAVWQSVQVKNPAHPRGSKSEDPKEQQKGEAGVVFAVDEKNDDAVVVEFADGKREAVLVEDLRSL